MPRKNILSRITRSINVFRGETQRDLQRLYTEVAQIHQDVFYFPPVSAGGVDLIFPTGTYVIGIGCANEICSRRILRIGLSFTGNNSGSNTAIFAVVDNISGNTIMSTANLTGVDPGSSACGVSITPLSQEGVVPRDTGMLVYVLSVFSGAIKNVNLRVEYEVFVPYLAQVAQ